jgi:5-methylthioribose kinase
MMDKPHIYPIVYKHDVDNMIMLMEKIGETLNSLKLSPHTQTEIMFNLVKHHIDKYVEVTDEIKESVMKEMNMWKSEICVTDDKFLQSLLPTYHNYLDAVIKKINWDKICIVHGDLHNLNVLKHKNGTYKLIDPDGSYNTAEFELGKLLGQIVVDAYSTMPIPEYTMTVLKEECQYLAKQSKCNEIDIFK